MLGCINKLLRRMTCLVEQAEHHSLLLGIVINWCMAILKARTIPMIIINFKRNNVWVRQPLLAAELYDEPCCFTYTICFLFFPWALKLCWTWLSWCLIGWKNTTLRSSLKNVIFLTPMSCFWAKFYYPEDHLKTPRMVKRCEPGQSPQMKRMYTPF